MVAQAAGGDRVLSDADCELTNGVTVRSDAAVCSLIVSHVLTDAH